MTYQQSAVCAVKIFPVSGSLGRLAFYPVLFLSYGVVCTYPVSLAANTENWRPFCVQEWAVVGVYGHVCVHAHARTCRNFSSTNSWVINNILFHTHYFWNCHSICCHTMHHFHFEKTSRNAINCNAINEMKLGIGGAKWPELLRVGVSLLSF